MNTQSFLRPKLGIVSRHLTVPELIVRLVPKQSYYPEFDGIPENTDSEMPFGAEKEYEDRLQGRLVNATRSKLSGIKYDLSYYDPAGVFLGLDKSRFLEEDELDVDDHLPIDLLVRLPDDVSECVFNVRAKMPGRLGRLFWG